MIETHFARIRARHALSTEEEAAIRSAMGTSLSFEAHHTFVEADTLLDVSILIVEGIAGRYKDLRDGQRQITELHVPGDFTDLHSFTLKRLDHNLIALTPCRVVLFPHAKLAELTERYPRIARLYWFSTNLDAAIHREWVLSMGRRSAIARTAHLFCELQVRLSLVGRADPDGFDFRLSQVDLAECLGMTSVHVNRSLRRLRELGLMTFRNGRAELHDVPGLRELAEFDPSYLYLDPPPL
ncbi:Crp/Fnr family transcriptional regulator [Sphingomonas sp. ST-64]|uniref:Crp/Fnr family transcriptional regulator n=1 Tax=Sphingomonas plantiphila TaxID=3163295 RepID=A0ABW8YT58_9SPHN